MATPTPVTPPPVKKSVGTSPPVVPPLLPTTPVCGVITCLQGGLPWPVLVRSRRSSRKGGHFRFFSKRSTRDLSSGSHMEGHV